MLTPEESLDSLVIDIDILRPATVHALVGAFVMFLRYNMR